MRYNDDNPFFDLANMLCNLTVKSSEKENTFFLRVSLKELDGGFYET